MAIVVIVEFSCFVWAMVVWDNIELDIKSAMTSYFTMTSDNKEPNSMDALRWDRLHVQVNSLRGNRKRKKTEVGFNH